MKELPDDKHRCIARVHRNTGLRFSTGGQCERRATAGKFCKQHSPEAKAARDQARNKRWENERKARYLNHYIPLEVGRAVIALLDKHQHGKEIHNPDVLLAAIIKAVRKAKRANK